MLRVQKISQAQAWQRTGRAGRQSAGACYRVYTRAEFDAMSRDTVPEIQRCSLASVALQLLTIGVKDVRNFDFLDRPDAQVSSSLLFFHYGGDVYWGSRARSHYGYDAARFSWADTARSEIIKFT